MIPPEVQYTRVGDAFVAYQVVGDGPIDLVQVTGMISNIDVQWEFPPYARFLERLAGFGRLIMFDRRGTGISDPVALDALPTWETWSEDLEAVLDATGSKRAAFFATLDGCLWAMLFAAIHPERTQGLVLWNPWVMARADPDNPAGMSSETLEAQMNTWAGIWGTRSMATLNASPWQDDPEAVRWMAKYYRSALAPAEAIAQMRFLSEIDARNVLPSVQAPTLVLHRRDWKLIPAPLVRYVADTIPGARFLDIPGADAYYFSDAIADLIEDFLVDIRQSEEPDRVLATVLFTDIVSSTERASALGDRKWKDLLAEHDRITRDQVDRFRGRLVTTTGDGMLATFDGPGRAIRCAHALGRVLHHHEIDIRAGLHTGEIELREGDDIGGIAVHIASRVMGEAGPGEVVCSRTVKDLVAGSEFAFTDRGVCALKGVPDEWQLYSVKPS